jgi:integrase
MTHTVTYTDPELCTYHGDVSQPWFVYFTITCTLTGAVKRPQFRGGINYWHTKEDRLREGNALRKMWKKKLEAGQYNPFSKGKASPVLIPDTIQAAVVKVLDLKKTALKKKSIRNYTDITNMFIKWLEDNSFHNLKLYQYTNQMAQAYLDYLIIERKYSGKSHNNQLGILKAFFNVMCAPGRKWMTDNPFKGIAELPEDVGNNQAYTDSEAKALIAYFKKQDRRMYYAVNFTYHAFIRKTELCELTVGQIDWDNLTIRMNSAETKNRIQDSVTISEGLLAVLREMGLDMAPKYFYIFGKGMQTCDEKCTRPDDVSDRHLVLRKASGLWADDGKAYYSWKHSGVVAYWKVVKDIYYMMRQLRHHDMKVTMVYLKSLGLMPNEAFRSATISL